ncbi:protein dopey-1 homolog isoform X2 [Toxorhynchites rutilus septentrionalis]|uniref:protein dopey-1 homolog isoform X2 n=1 Tax=Toxorhynchites rutilus septentrionalis TaxID=329112 RepID=UPI00247B04E6|nr:protein dopey-1 homolog isoform X2 [Toxorhynchites rutilus septentrionalis]
MDTATGSGLMEEYDLMKQSKYRVYMSNIDKALKNFEYSSEWADLISALGKLNKVISSNSQYQIIPRRIKISKRLAQCMHPALPSGVHLKALESYDVIFSNIGVDRLASELFIYSAGLFPLLGYSAMNVRPTLLSIYEKYFVPLGEKLRPALSGFLSGVFPGLESGQDHFERTSSLLDKVCAAVKPECFYTCLWECIVTNASVRLPAMSYVVERFDKKRTCAEQKELMGSSVELLVTGLCSCLNDSVILVQRNTLEFLLLAFPLHAIMLSNRDVVKLVKTALNTILRRDMSLNRRLYSWLLGADTSLGKHPEDVGHEGKTSDPNSYFESHSKEVLISAFKLILKSSILCNPIDLSPYRILISLLDKAEIGQRILDDVLCDIIRTISLCNGNLEVQKSANLLFSTFDPSYIWNYMSNLYRDAAVRKHQQRLSCSRSTTTSGSSSKIREEIRIDSGAPGTVEVCFLTEFLLETLSLEMYNETTRIYLPKFLLSLIRMLTVYSENMNSNEVAASLKLCVKIVSKVQPMIMSEKVLDLSISTLSDSIIPEGQEAKESISLEKSNSDSKIHESSLQVSDGNSFTRSNSSQGLNKKSKYSKKSKKSKSYTKLSELDQPSVASTHTASAVSSIGSHTTIATASSTPNLKNEDGTGGESSQEERQSSSSSNSSSDRDDIHSDVVLKVPTQVPPAQLPDCPILEKCIKQYVLFYEMYVCRQIFDGVNLESSGSSESSSSEQVSLQDNLFINSPADDGSMLNDDVFVVNALLPELDDAFQAVKINGVSTNKKLKTILAKTMDQRKEFEVFEQWKSAAEVSPDRESFEVEGMLESNNKLKRLVCVRVSESLRSSLKLACNVLTEMSSFPSYGNDWGASERCDDIPGWLKALAILASFIGDLDTQLSAAQTLIDMISLLRTNGRKPKASNSGTTFVMMMPLLKLAHVSYLEKKTKVFQVLTTMLWNHLEANRPEARTISVLLYRIHSCFDTKFTENVIISKLLVTSRESSRADRRCLSVYWTIPTLTTTELKIDPVGFRKFQLLWKLGRDTHHGKEFEKLLFLVLDVLTLPSNLSIQISASKWLQEALVRGDIGRIMKPLLRILLNESTKRLSIVYTKRYKQDADAGSEWEKDLVADGDSFVDKECFAVSSEDGCIRYHMDNVLSKKRSPIRTIQKKIFGVSIGSKSNSSQVSNYITNDSTKEVTAVADDSNYSKISVIINPLESELNGGKGSAGGMRTRSNSAGLINCEQGTTDAVGVESGSLPNGVDKKDFHRSTSDIDESSDGDFERKKGRLSGGSYSRSTTATDLYDTETIKRYVEDGPIVDFVSKSGDRFRNRKTYLISSSNLAAADEDGFISSISDRNLNYSFNSNASFVTVAGQEAEIVFGIGPSDTTTLPVADSISGSSAFGGESQRSSSTSKDSGKHKDSELFGFGRRKNWRNSSKLYPFHTHYLIYESIFNTKQILYTLETLKNILANESRFFLCLSVTTSVSSSQIRSALLKHRKNVFGKGFSDSKDEAEHQNLYRGCMYLEVIVTILLYYTRSYYQKDDEHKLQPTKDDINGNSKIQLECIQLMTKIFVELLSIVKDVGRNLANYIADLMEKCKVQKILLYCMASSVNYFTSPQCYTYSDEILVFNDPESSRLYAEAYQIELLNLMLAVIKLEHEIMIQRNDERFNEGIKNVLSTNSPTRPAPENKRIYKYIPNQLVSQQPMFLSAVLSALQSEKLNHIHKNWTDMLTSCLTCLPLNNLTNIVISIIHQLCANLDRITKRDRIYNQCTDYIVSQLEAITILAHYCLLDSSQQISLANVFSASNSMTSPASNSGQIINSIVNVLLSSSLLNVNQVKNNHQEVAKTAILSHLPRIIITIATLWETSVSEFRHVKHQLLEFLSPISLHYGLHFLTAISVAWYERSSDLSCVPATANSSDSNNSTDAEGDFFDVMARALPQGSENQLLLVKLISGIRIMSVDSFIQTMHQVIKSPPQIYQPPIGLNLEVSALELLFFYLKSVAQTQFSDCWGSLYVLLKDCLSLQIPAQFVALSILNEFVQRCPNIPFSDKKDLRDLHDVTSRLVEAISNVAGSCLEQTTWLRRNLSVKEEFSSIESTKDGLLMPSNQHYSIQAQSILAVILAPLLDVAFSSQEKDKVNTIVTGVMYNIVPYLKTHTLKNVPTFHACSNLLASLSTYQYTRKAWRKDAIDLLLDATFFQFDSRCLPYWKTIMDSLMTCDNTTFRDLMNRLPLAQTGSLNIFTSKEQEYEQRALLLKRLAFVIFCSENDQYHKFMPEIQEQLANSLRLPQVVPLIQSAVFLCFRVLLLRMSADNVTSLWPIIIAEMVQVFLSIEQELMTDTEEFSQHIRMLSGLDTAWVTNTNNGLYSYGHPHWRMVQLETAKLLELGCVLPATILPHFQMYRWAFVSGQNEHFLKPGSSDVAFIPHVTRISQLMDFRYTSHSPKPQTNKGSHIMLSCQSINTLQDLYSFFSTLSMRWPSHISYTADSERDTKLCLDEVEKVLALDFLEKIPSTK